MSNKKTKIGFWFGLILAAVVVWWWLRQLLDQDAEDRSAVDRSRSGLSHRKTLVLQAGAGRSEPQEALSEPQATVDDLRQIDGIGPKISSVLVDAEITTFAKLAAADVGQLRDILRAAGIRQADPGTWSEQAALAARDEWDRLGFFQSELKGGRRV